MKSDETYRIFCETRQEALRLEAALQGFFDTEQSEERREKFGIYLKRRIRSAGEKLVDAQDITKLACLERLGWFGRAEVDQFLRLAIEKKRYAAVLWLQRLKSEKYGYQNRDFSL